MTSGDYRTTGLVFASLESVLMLILAAFVLFKSIYVHKVKGLTLNLLFIELFGAVCSFLQFLVATVGTRQRDNNHSNGVLVSFTVFAALNIGSNFFVLWIFSLKYWSLSIKLQKIKSLKDQNQLNSLFQVLLYGGLSLITLAVIFAATSLLQLAQTELNLRNDENTLFSGAGITDFVIVLASTLLSFLLLFVVDGYRRLRTVELSEVTVKSLFIFAQITCTLIFIALMITNVWAFNNFFHKTPDVQRTSTVVYTPLNIASSLVLFIATTLLIIVVYDLIRKQAQFYRHESDHQVESS